MQYSCANLRGLAVSLEMGNTDNVFKNNTLYISGNSVAINPGKQCYTPMIYLTLASVKLMNFNSIYNCQSC